MPNSFTLHGCKSLLNSFGIGRYNAVRTVRLAQLVAYPTGGNQVQLRVLKKECINCFLEPEQ
jgi:hypothetical protein